ncbi:flagellar hook assembly protein FlgD [Metabacillus idriensis]|uniref:flagellar hook assembly protein FlgD n=1 Tax=Bacillaceae TaxID=186817 RepID=UPI00105AA7EC|nr:MULTISPECIES: flagellar hook assembly protein FlgD [Bacillaceae]MDR0137370.1 flagellar hook assembly protein FlgD [Metabacillus idriensis]TDL83328.1 flagellar hook assembly protein FlgD [Peribacillus frigoritolerans]
MTQTTIDAGLLISSINTAERTGGKSSLGKDDFLKILIAQLQNQDPLNPMEDKEFISQMASFSSLEQMTNMSTQLSDFIQLQVNDGILKYSEMIGKQVEWESGDGKSSGIVKSIKQSGADIILEMQDGKEVPSALITKVTVQDS